MHKVVEKCKGERVWRFWQNDETRLGGVLEGWVDFFN